MHYKIKATNNGVVVFICEFKRENDEAATRFLDRVTRMLIDEHGDEITTNLYREEWINGV